MTFHHLNHLIHLTKHYIHIHIGWESHLFSTFYYTFFQSDVVRAELAEIQELQEEVYGALFKFPSMPKADKEYHVEVLERLIEKQKVLYTRLSLSDDPMAKKMKENILKGAADMGLPPNVDMNLVFDDIHKMVDVMKKAIDEDRFNM